MLRSPQNLPARIAAVQERVARAAGAAGRSAQSVTLLAIGKAQPVPLLGAAAACGGGAPGELGPLAAAVAALPRLTLRGLMCIPPEETEPARQRAWFAQLRQLRDQLNAGGARLDTLSMGMSGDFEAAIAEGATIVRLGTALFGPRP